MRRTYSPRVQRDGNSREVFWSISELHALNKTMNLFGVLVEMSRNAGKGQNSQAAIFNSKAELMDIKRLSLALWRES